MTTPFIGRAEVEAVGKVWRLVLDFNAICHFEAATGHEFFQRAAAWDKRPPAGVELRAVIHAAMQLHHPEATVEDAGNLLSADMSLFSRLMAAAMAGMEQGARADARPGKRKAAGT